MRALRQTAIEIAGILFTVVAFWIPFYFIFVNAGKDAQESSLLNLSWPSTAMFWENIKTVVAARDFMLIRAFYNSTVLTVVSIAILVVLCAMAGYVLQRRSDRATPVFNFLILAGLIVPPAIVPTIWVLDGIGLFKTMSGLILVEVALNFPFAVLLYKGFMAAIPREIDEAAVMDGCGGLRLFFRIVLPLLQPVTATIIVLSSVTIFNDFTNPLYFLPGSDNVTVQLTLYNFQSQYVTQYNLLFTNILLITIPPLLLFIFFNKRIVAGMTAGSVKG
ncbi:carbohydrate ABC transporter permease [Paenibacillus cisolokensis]|uniref:Sugar ABC transporter permease n=1 Tax=Paenibacillus cisolokensis TaxID=1658519 RepID=A0ABQ4N5T0_9BACL|nr:MULTISPECIES: carbohydrate ABC transporter permease [Paenibacillus]ALS28477.1 ABC transporter [Paenibacillus sp. 32O-W]GIQ63517.1 sugar ABC transporter permease [Paenibacillus cisolokensis]